MIIMDKRTMGKKGEAIALNYLLAKGYKLIYENYYSRWGEIDLIVFDHQSGELVFVEVKTRSSDSFGHPEDAIDEYKLERLNKAADRYLQKYEYDGDYRFDCLAIEMDYESRRAKIRQLKNIG
ncbi:hypothetical protein CO134_03655 [Candidatus Kuenenbacteria bacterium CG_4_9_14_3_um_filter_39_14]|uniref:UPF0102 protein COZ84_03260 n=6 Tax=Candidatus Kueneniibacteriota TaxID=1752740 RepID=A0A2M7IL47_9BACT|nr:MAG: hypothetical protein COX28_00720 [Candidatus Kuenenbacteria bacterium CG23_combo_of_CG06-09_8_20_14_all_39_39]PIP75903.1 MAG: hypothetical protein COW86_01135 [Candidatus Kuenenbacteria bacterium CG22_combo_CG10-13_8_21_14_all_39_9]PIR80766.1 MAG: hypothetical protein COU24_02205 [Candidatus Kuenenbacteria bacterium CG10_big_fil_rev_8_21_14_0_10_39_14]PIW95488.1 MAG: hypothetical protein COZ84_03260 [Candidatus Kuenenbacteria bacterium CG_4_8_14_3_um_filter_39_15]PIX92535.1 MAG: hypothe